MMSVFPRSPWQPRARPPPGGTLASLVWGQEVGRSLSGKVPETALQAPGGWAAGPPAVVSARRCVSRALTQLSPWPLTGTFVSAFTVLCGARTDLPDRHVCCVFWLNIAAALIQILTAIVMVGWIMSIFWGMDMVILASE